MLRAVSTIYFESQALESLASARRDVYKLLRIKRLSSTAAAAPHAQTVLASEPRRAQPGPGAPPPPPPPGTPPPAPPRRAWPLTAAALALTASLGGVYLYRRRGEERPAAPEPEPEPPAPAPEPYPASGELFPAHVQYLLVGGGTASFAAMRAIRAARPDASVLIVGDEPLPPYMRPPLSKEAWREPALAAADAGDPPSFRQWNGKRRPLLYEPPAFYVPVERAGAGGGAAAARGWTVVRLDVTRHEAELRAPGRAPVTLTYGRCLLAPGLRARRLPALQAARDAGRAFAVRDVRDAARLARAVDAPDTRDIVLVGGGFLATELAAALAERAPGKRVTQLCREEAPLARVLPPYLAAEAARRLRAAGVAVRGGVEVEGSAAEEGGGGVRLRLAGGGEVRADAVVECAGGAADGALARASGLEADAEGALVVNAELQARADVWAAGDAASWHDPALGRRRLEHHDHAVHSGRRAGENMASDGPQRPYDHQPMFWSDLGPDLGYEAIGIVDSRLHTVGVFSAADVHDVPAEAGAAAEAGAGAGAQAQAQAEARAERRYSRGVVFYTRERRVVGVLLWNLFNRMHVARQVLAHGEFDDLFEVAKLFSLHEDD